MVRVLMNGKEVGKIVDGDFEKVRKFTDFLDYETPTEAMYNICGPNDLICKADYLASYTADGLGMSWVYKWINHNVDVVMESFGKEFNNIFSIFMY